MKNDYLSDREVQAAARSFPPLIRHAILRNLRGIKVRRPTDHSHAVQLLMQLDWYESPEGVHYWFDTLQATLHGRKLQEPPFSERYLYYVIYTAKDVKGNLYENYQVGSETPYRDEIFDRIESVHGNVQVSKFKTYPVYERLKDLRNHPLAYKNVQVSKFNWYLDGPLGRLVLVSRGSGQDTVDSLYLQLKSNKLKLLASSSSLVVPPSNGKKEITESRFQQILNKYLP